MKILVTGGAGFIGSHITDAYIEAGHNVVIVDDLSSGSRKKANARARLVLMDVRDPNISTLFAKEKFDIVNHHAAQIDVRRSVQDPFYDASVNILGALRLLECCRTYSVKKFIFASSGGALYGECTDGAATETQEIRPLSPYGFSKAAAEVYIRFYGETYDLAYTILRYSNVYGPRQDPNGEAGVISIFARDMAEGAAPTIFGDGSQSRDYVYVADVVAANLAALTDGKNETINISTGVATSVIDLQKQMASFFGQSSAPIYAQARLGEVKNSVLNAKKASQCLRWSPQSPLQTGLKKTIESFRSAPRSTAKR